MTKPAALPIFTRRDTLARLFRKSPKGNSGVH
jgi:hypothetical protein